MPMVKGCLSNFAEAGKGVSQGGWIRAMPSFAQFNLGAMYAEGLGLAQDYPEAAKVVS